VTSTHDHDTTYDALPPSRELPPFVFVPADDVPRGADTVATEPPTADEAKRPRRWSTGHTVAATVVAVGVLASGGVALAARDGGTGATTVPVAPGTGQQGQLPGGQLPGGQLPGGQLPGGQLPGGGFGHDHDDDGSGFPGGQLPGSTDGTDGTDGTTSSGVTT